VALLPPPTWAVPVDPDASLPEPPTTGFVDALTPSADAVVPASAPPAWAAPVESEELLPPPSWAAPVDPDAVLPLPPLPALVASTALWPAAPADADGAVWVPLAWTAPVELEELLPPPTWAVPVEPVELLSPGVTEAGPPTVTAVCSEPALTCGFALADDTCTAPVELDAELLPPFDAA
jgi:hypothetical protein